MYANGNINMTILNKVQRNTLQFVEHSDYIDTFQNSINMLYYMY